MRQLIDETSAYLGIGVQTIENILISILIIVLSIIVRWITVGILSRRLADTKEKYYWVRATIYIISTLNFILLIIVGEANSNL